MYKKLYHNQNIIEFFYTGKSSLYKEKLFSPGWTRERRVARIASCSSRYPWAWHSAAGGRATSAWPRRQYTPPSDPDQWNQLFSSIRNVQNPMNHFTFQTFDFSYEFRGQYFTCYGLNMWAHKMLICVLSCTVLLHIVRRKRKRRGGIPYFSM